MDVLTVPFDPERATREEWRRFHAYRRLRSRETEPDDPINEDRTTEKATSRPDPQWIEFRLAVLDPEHPEVQIGEVDMEIARPGAPSYESNRHIAWTWIHLLRAYRGRGLGTRLLPKLAEFAREHRQTILHGWCEEPAGKAFAEFVGARVTQHRRENRLRFENVDWSMVEKWAADGPARNPDTELRWFVGRIDDDVIEAYCKTYTQAMNQQPFGKEEHGEYVFTPDTFRDREKRYAVLGLTWTTAATIERNGEVSGLTETGWHPDRPTFLSQMLTGVHTSHRGRGLGKWVKAVMLLRVRREFPQVRVVVTGNASSNAAMLSINERLGFRTHKEPVVVEMKSEELERFVAGRTTTA